MDFNDSDFELNDCTPPEIAAAAAEAINEIIPQKSKKRYYQVYGKFVAWQNEKKVPEKKKDTEHVLLSYFKEKLKEINAGSLWSVYSMLKSVLKAEKRIDISKYPLLLEFIKKKSKGYKPKKAPVLRENHLAEFFRDCPNSDEFLPIKVAAIYGILGACRTDELVKASVNDIQLYKDEKNGAMYVVKIPEENKTNDDRTFIISSQTYFKVVELYLNIRPKESKTDRLFLRVVEGRCVNMPIGINKLYTFPKKIAEFLKLDNSDAYTGHSFRRTSTTTLANAGADLQTIKRHGGWKSSKAAEGYVEDSIYYKKKTENLIVSRIEEENVTPSTSKDFSGESIGMDEEECNQVHDEALPAGSRQVKVGDLGVNMHKKESSIHFSSELNDLNGNIMKTFTFSNCSNCVFNININKN